MQVYLHTPDQHAPLLDLGEVEPTRPISDLVTVDQNELLWRENDDDPVDLTTTIGSVATETSAVLHLHRHARRRITTEVRYNGRTITDEYGPGTTVAKIHRQSTKEFGIDRAEATDLVLRLRNTTDDLDPEDHLGTLAGPRGRRVELDLVPGQRFAG